MSKHESEKRTSPQKNNPTTHYTPETPVNVGDHVGRGGTVVDCGHGGHGGCGGGCGGEVVDRDMLDPLMNKDMNKEVYIKVWEWSMMSLIHLENILPHHHLAILL